MKAARVYLPADWVDPRLEIRPSPIHGQGMFAAAPIPQNETVIIWGGTILLTADDIAGIKTSQWLAEGYVWVAIAENLYLAARVPPGEQDRTNFINHACDPNFWMHNEITLIVRRDINSGEELTIDYALFEADEAWTGKFECRCRSNFCRRRISGQDWRRQELQDRYRDRECRINCVNEHLV